MIHSTNNPTIRITAGGQVRQFPQGITPIQIATNMALPLTNALACQINGKPCDLTHTITEDATIHLLSWQDKEGKQVFWHSAAHLLAAALTQLYPAVQLTIGPAIEEGFYYDIDLNIHKNSLLDLAAIEQTILQLAQQKLPFIRQKVSKQHAIDFFTQKGNPYKLALLQELEADNITFYQIGNFIDLCKGPHLPHSGWIQAVKILNIAGAYWRGDEKNKQLTRIYGIAFPNEQELATFFKLKEEATQRNHQKIGKALKLFSFSEKVGLGLPLWLPKGALLCDALIQFLKKEQLQRGYQPVITPHIGHKELYITSGHYEKYQEDCFQPIHTAHTEESYLLKPMNCPHHCEIYSSEPRSYKELPLRLAEFGTVYRYERHGALHGLTRTRSFTQDDSHIFCRPDQIEAEVAAVIDLVLYLFKILRFTDYTARLSFRDPISATYIGEIEEWHLAEQAMQSVTKAKGLPTTLAIGEAAFYGPKIDFMIRDALGRHWQLGTVQLDYQLPIRFNLSYIDANGKKQRPIIIHRAPMGSLERLIAILLEHTAGRLPLWLAPEQAAVIALSHKYNGYATQVHQLLLTHNIRSKLDTRNETIGKKIRAMELEKIPYILVTGEKEMQTASVAVRKKGNNATETMLLADFIKKISTEITTYQ